jgi:excisionase family DNA binding protein
VLTLDELAAYLRVPVADVQPLVERGAIPGRQIGAAWRFSRAAIDDWLAGPAWAETAPAAPTAAPEEGAVRELPEGAARDLPAGGVAAPPIEFVGAHPNNFTAGRKGRRPIAISNHEMQGTLAGTIPWFNNAAAVVSSNYGIGKNGRIVQFVRDEDTAYANGPVRSPNLAAAPWIADAHARRQDMNSLTISIEWEGLHKGGRSGSVAWFDPDKGKTVQVPVDLMKGSVREFWVPTEAQYQAGLRLIRFLAAKHGIPLDRAHIVRHSDFDSVHKWFCPGDGFPMARLITDLGGQIDPGTPPEPVPPPAPAPGTPPPAPPTDFPLLGPPTVSQTAFSEVLIQVQSPAAAETDPAAYYMLCTANGVDPLIALAFFAQETDYGRQPGAADNKNWGNLWDHAAGHIGQYDSWQEGLRDWCNKLQHDPYPQPPTVRSIVPVHRGTDRTDNDEYADQLVALIQMIQGQLTEKVDEN